jgi:gliding motility-associated-like protein
MRTKITHLALLLALLGPGALRTAQAQTVYVPATVTGYTEDVVAEGTSTSGPGTVASQTTATVDRGNSSVRWCFATTNYQNPAGQRPTRGLPQSGLITSISTPGLTYQMGPFSGNNSLRIDGASSGTLTLTNPQPCSEVMVLATEGNGSIAPKSFTVFFTDGSRQDFTNIVVPDWFGGTITPAIIVGSRVNRPDDVIDNPANDPRIYEVRLTLAVANYSKSVERVFVSKQSTDPVLNVMGISLGSNCLGVPTGGTTAANLATVCPGQQVVLGLSGASATGGITYQWQASTDGGTTYTNVAGATTIFLTATPSVTTRYRVVVTCRLQSSNSSAVTVTVPSPVATVAYAAPGQPATFCAAGTAPVLTATPAGGTFSSTAGLVINPTTGTINLATSTAGTYTVTYTATTPCQATGTTVVTINRPVATLDYSQARYCRNGANAVPVATPAGGTFSSTAGLVLNATTGVIDVRASQLGKYRVAYLSGGACPATAQDSVTIAETTATLAYSASPYCRSGNSGVPTATPAGGTFSSTAGLAINPTTGVVDLPNSAPNTYTVTYTVGASGNVCLATATTSIVVKDDALPKFPNVLTPNGDGKNDELKLTISDVTGYRLRVFNRWGRKVYEGNDAAKGWKAEDSSAGMYYYQVEYADCAGRRQEQKTWIEVVK